MARYQRVVDLLGAEEQWGRRAKARVTRLSEELHKAVEAALEPIRKEAAALQAQKRYGAAAELFAELPRELRDEPFARAVADKAAGDLRAAGATEWAELLTKSRSLAESGDLAAARGVLEPARAFGLPAVTTALDTQLGVLAEAEKTAAERGRQKVVENYAKFQADLRKLMAGRQYGEARGLLEKQRQAAPAELANKLAADQADLDAVSGIYQQALNRLKNAKPEERFTLAGTTGRFQKDRFDGEKILLLQKVGAELEQGINLQFSKLGSADLLYLAGLAGGGKTAEDADKYLRFTVFDGTPAPDTLKNVLALAKARGLDTSRFDALLVAAQTTVRDREAAAELQRLEVLVKDRRWEEVLSAGRRLTDGYADTPTLKTRARR